MSAPDKSSAKKTGGWVEPLVWSLLFIAGIVTAAVVSRPAREVILQGVGYLFAFFSTPFVLEATAAFIGLSLVGIINSRRIEKEGDGWVVMEVKKKEDAEAEAPAQKTETTV